MKSVPAQVAAILSSLLPISWAQLIIENPAQPDQTPRILRSVYIDPNTHPNYYQQHRTLPRFLQVSGGNLPDIIANGNECQTLGGLQFMCSLYTSIPSSQYSVDVNTTIICDLGQTQFDFRRANGCSCSALITPTDPTKFAKICPCYVCPIGFGSSSVSIDCVNYVLPTNGTMTPTMAPGGGGTGGNSSVAVGTNTSIADTVTLQQVNGSTGTFVPVVSSNSTASPSGGSGLIQTSPPGSGATMPPSSGNMTHNNNNSNYDPFIFADCSSIDCAANCNGTCSLGCGKGAGPTCPFCAGAAGSPTPAPTGTGNGQIQKLTSGGGVREWTTTAARRFRMGVLATIVAVWAL